MAEEGRGPTEAAELTVAEELSARTARALCAAVRRRLESGVPALLLNLEQVKTTDAVGMAALLQSVRLAGLLGTAARVAPSPAVCRALLALEILEEVPLDPVSHEPPTWGAEAAELIDDDSDTYLARTQRVGLRLPRWEEAACFTKWADDPLLDQMVGSDLLYVCRHLGAHHPDFVSLLFHDARSITVLVEPVDPVRPPVGFVRLYNVRLAEQFAFLEIAIADPGFHRRGWGIEAARLFAAYGADTLGLRRVETKVYAYNILSANSLRRNGFQQEGVLRQAKLYDGQWWDILVFGILGEEMAAQFERARLPYMGFWR